MDFEAVIGLEIHVELKTRSKMFSAAPNGFSRWPNTQVSPFDMAFPGTLPSVNKAAVIHAIRLASALHMDIDPVLRFDRKNYFYPDLPKGYQITQQFHPLGRNGYLDIIDGEGKSKRIAIERIHLEEDSCKQVHGENESLLDYNRAGVPLIEIVSSPELRSGTEAMNFVEAIRRIVVYAGVSDGKMEEGSLRCDVNVSLRPFGSNEYGTKVEVKNLNSIKNIETAIDLEISRQSQLLQSGETVQQETRRFDDAMGRTLSLRRKSDAVDYKYFPEANLPPIRLSEDFIAKAIESCPELYEAKKARYLVLGISPVDADTLLIDPAFAAYFDEALKGEPYAKTFLNFLLVEVRGFLNKTASAIQSFPLAPKELLSIVKLHEEGYTHKQVVDVFHYCLEHVDATPAQAIEALQIVLTRSDDDFILGFIRDVLDANPQSIADFKAGKDRVLGYLVGQVLKATKGKASPSAVAAKLSEELRKR